MDEKGYVHASVTRRAAILGFSVLRAVTDFPRCPLVAWERIHSGPTLPALSRLWSMTMNKFAILLAFSAPLSVLFLGTPGLAQKNLLKDSGFESGLGSWKITGGKFYAGFEKIDCDGDGAKSQCLSVSPDATNNPFYLYQKVAITKGKTYWFRASVRGTGSLKTSNWSEVRAGLAMQPTWLHQALPYSNPHTSGKGWVVELAFPFTASTNYTYITLRLMTGSRAGLGFKIHIDDIELYEMGGIPWSHCTTVRNLTPKTIGIRTFGKPGSLYLMWLGTKRLSKGIAIPGITGLLEMDPSGGMIMLTSGVIKTNGYDDLSLPLPASIYKRIQGQPLYWMPVQVTSLPTTVALGKVASWGFL